MDFDAVAERLSNLTSAEIAPVAATLELTTYSASLLEAVQKNLGENLRSSASRVLLPLNDKIQARAAYLSELSPKASQRALLAVLCQIAETKYPSTAEADGSFMSVLLASLADGLQGKRAGSQTITVDQFIELALMDIARHIEEAITGADESSRQHLAQSLLAWHADPSTPQEAARIFREIMDLREVTVESVKNALPRLAGLSGTYALFSMGGFGSYVALTTITHMLFTTLLGMTVPFGVYTGVTTLGAAIFSPVVFIALAAGTIGSTYSRTGRQARKRLAALSPALLLAGGSSDPEGR